MSEVPRSQGKRANRRRRLLGWGLCLATGLLALLAHVPAASGAYLARVNNTTDTAASNGYFTCSNAAVGEPNTKAYFAYPFNEATGLIANDATGNNRPGTYSATGVTYRVANGGLCPRDNGTVITLDGVSGSVTSLATLAAAAGPQVFSVEIWFKTTVKGGKLIGFGGSATGSSSNYDRHLYIDSNGLVRFGVYNNAVYTAVSPVPVNSTSSYADGTWHEAVGTLSAAGLKLYVDGKLVGTNTTDTLAQVFSGYWRIGYDNLTGWTNAPGNFFFTGSLAWAAVYTYALSDAQVAAHYAAGRS